MLEQEAAPSITAYLISENKLEMPIVPAYSRRDWMGQNEGHAYHCLPLTMANQAGWFLLNPHGFTATWDGGSTSQAVTIAYDDPIPSPKQAYLSTGFGQGVLTFNLPYLFRTSPGYNLLVRGPANWRKDAIQPLEGLVESEWLESTFTMNWIFTREGTSVRFEKDEPFCMLVPFGRGMLETFTPELQLLSSNPELKATYKQWGETRNENGRKAIARMALARAAQQPIKLEYDGNYFKGVRVQDGERFAAHQTRLDIKPFHAKWHEKIIAFLEKMRLG